MNHIREALTTSLARFRWWRKKGYSHWSWGNFNGISSEKKTFLIFFFQFPLSRERDGSLSSSSDNHPQRRRSWFLRVSKDVTSHDGPKRCPLRKWNEQTWTERMYPFSLWWWCVITQFYSQLNFLEDIITFASLECRATGSGALTMFDRKTIIRSSQYADDEFPPCFHHKFSLFSAKIPAQCQGTHRRSSRTTPIIVFSLRMKLYSNFKLIFHSILLAVAAAFLEALCRNGAEITVRRARPHRWNEREFSLPIACGSLVFLSSSTHTPHHFPLFFDFFFCASPNVA